MSGTESNLRDSLLNCLRCDSGAVITTELVLVSVVAVIGLFVGYSALRDSVVSELGDTSLSVQSVNQSLTFNGTVGASSTTAGSNWNDALDCGDGVDISGSIPGFDFSAAPQDESNLEEFLQSKDYRFEMTRLGFTWTGTGDFDNGVYTGSPYWPGNYTVNGTIVTVVLDALGGGWDDGTIVMDASDPNNITGNLTWINSITGFVWEAVYNLFCL